MKVSKKIEYIKKWILNYCKSMNKPASSLVIGVSGGIDSSVVSTICAMTGKKTFAVSMPIKQIKQQYNLSLMHQKWLRNKYKNVHTPVIELDNVFKNFKKKLNKYDSTRGFANSRSRLRMTTLYQIAQSNNGLVVGTGNKVEDFGVGFYTKYGDGGVDIAPIADCTKNEVWEIGKELGILEDIVTAIPTDGLWDDGRTDENQMGLTYTQIEEAMKNKKSKFYKKYSKIRIMNLHKMSPIPVCKIKKNVKYSICSCGKSDKLPYCDNNHRKYNAENNCSYKSVKIYFLDDNPDKLLKIMCSNWDEDAKNKHNEFLKIWLKSIYPLMKYL